MINKSQSVIAHTVEEELIDIHDNQDDIKRLNQTMAALIDDFTERFANVKRNQFETAILRASFATLLNSIDISKKTKAVLMARRGELDPKNFNWQKLSLALEHSTGRRCRMATNFKPWTPMTWPRCLLHSLLNPRRRRFTWLPMSLCLYLGVKWSFSDTSMPQLHCLHQETIQHFT